MTDRFPLIANSSSKRIEELRSGDNLNLQNSGIVGATTITANKFVGTLQGNATSADRLNFAENITSGTISSSRLSGYYGINVNSANILTNAANITSGFISSDRLTGDYNIRVYASAYADTLIYAENILTGTINPARLSGSYNISVSSASTSSGLAPGLYDVDISGNAATATTATNLSNAANITTGTISSSRLSGSYSIDITGNAETATTATNVVGGIGSIRQLQVTGISTFTNGPVLIGTGSSTGISSQRLQVSGGAYVSGLVGIGTTNPTTNLDVVGGINISGVSTFTNGPVLIGTGSSTGISSQRLQVSGGAYVSGLVGIGTTNPTTNLDVVGGINISGVSTLGTVKISSGIVTATSGVVTYYGDGSTLSNIVTKITAGIGISLTPTTGIGIVQVESYRPNGKTIFVSQNGNDDNTGLAVNHPKRSIKAAASIAFPGDTIKIFPGTYIEDNPIVLGKTVSIEGTELRNCVITPRYTDRDLFYVNNSVHMTNLSFIGPDMSNGSAVVSLKPLIGVSTDRFFDAARMIRLNLDFIASEAVGYLTSTEYRSPVFTIGITTQTKCISDIKSILKAVCYDITRGGNSKSVGAGKSYYTDAGALQYIVGVKTETIAALNYAAGIARAVVNNVTWGAKPVGIATSVTNAVYSNITGVTTITAVNHGLVKDDAVRVVGLGFTCPSGIATLTYPTGSVGYIFNVKSVVGVNTFEVIVGQSTLPHTYVSGGTVQKYTNFQNNYTQVKDLAMQADPTTGFNNGINGCANVVSAIYSCVGVVTTIINNGLSALGGAGIKTTYPGNLGIGFTTVIGVTSALYDNATGNTTLTVPGLPVKSGDMIEVRDLNFSCNSGGGISTQKFPSGRYGYEFYVNKINNDGTFVINTGVSTLSHNYVDGGFVVNRSIGVTTAIYNNVTGVATITANGAYVKVGDIVTLIGLGFTCPSGPGIVTYPSGNLGYNFRVDQVIGTAGTTFVVNVGTSTLPHTYVSGGIVKPAYSSGVGPITQGPYVRNSTNFIGRSIGLKVDGFAAEPGDQDDIGVTGTMSVDSYTQYNQGGIGVSITNGGYAQLVSIFTICDDIAIYTASGGQCDITNSNSSFGNYGLYATGVGDNTTKSIYRYTGVAVTDATERTNIVTISGVGTNRPYDGQSCYFGTLYYNINDIGVDNGGSGYTAPPTVTISNPTGPSGVVAQATATVVNGSVTAINLLNSGSQYLSGIATVIIAPPAGAGITATASVSNYQPIYYKVSSATLPSSGISTVSFLQTLNNTVSAGTTVYFARGSLQLASTISFEHVGAGTNIFTAKPALGGVVIPENKVIQLDGGTVTYTSTDQSGNFNIGDGVTINQSTGEISGRDFVKALFTTVTPFILALTD
jgi:hypothetical protein